MSGRHFTSNWINHRMTNVNQRLPSCANRVFNDIIIIIIIIKCNWVVTLWQWLFYMYTKQEAGYY